MNSLNIITVFVLAAAMILSCGKDESAGGGGTSEGTAVKGTPGAIGTNTTGIFSGGSAFMYRTLLTHHFLLCEGEAKNWKDALTKPHLEIGISDASILSDITAMADPSRAINVNDPAFAHVECPVSVRWNPGNGMRFYNKYSYTAAPGCYQFETGSLMVAEGPMKGMFTIAFVGSGRDNENKGWSADWSYGGQFSK